MQNLANITHKIQGFTQERIREVTHGKDTFHTDVFALGWQVNIPHLNHVVTPNRQHPAITCTRHLCVSGGVVGCAEN